MLDSDGQNRLKRVNAMVLLGARDEVAAVQVEFVYGVDINIAANEVTTELSRVTGTLPAGIRNPLVFKTAL